MVPNLRPKAQKLLISSSEQLVKLCNLVDFFGISSNSSFKYSQYTICWKDEKQLFFESGRFTQVLLLCYKSSVFVLAELRVSDY